MQYLTAHPYFLPAAVWLTVIGLALAAFASARPKRALLQLALGHARRWFTLPMLAALGLLLLPAMGFAQDAAAAPPPVPNKGDTAWMLTSTALVLLMSVPGLALFY
ncbi:MAG TPA: hypothetical protein VEZ88_13495, partial [Steroidobacteraceae bacterium]|nr:hypothetical protein [Steroidobacteraceae bacterium]